MRIRCSSIRHFTGPTFVEGTHWWRSQIRARKRSFGGEKAHKRSLISDFNSSRA